MSSPPGSSVTRRSLLKMSLAAALLKGTATFAQDVVYSSESLLAYSRFLRSIRDMDGFLRAISFQRSAISTVNFFGVSVGGIDALNDLEESRGVDPETFAGLYAGFAIPDVARHLNLKKEIAGGGKVRLEIEASDGRLRYKGAAVRLYSQDRLRGLFERRSDFRQEDEKRKVAALTQYVLSRQQSIARETSGSDKNEVQELADRYRGLQQMTTELEDTISTDITVSSVLQNADPHLFGLSVGGLDVATELNESQAVDPITYAAILANYVTPEVQSSMKFEPGRVLYNDAPLQLYSMQRLEECFKLRERISQLSRQ